MNLRRTLRDLTDAGFSVVVCQEVPWMPPVASCIVYKGLMEHHLSIQVASRLGSKGRKDRFIGGIVSPASPAYLYDLVLSDDCNPEGG